MILRHHLHLLKTSAGTRSWTRDSRILHRYLRILSSTNGGQVALTWRYVAIPTTCTPIAALTRWMQMLYADTPIDASLLSLYIHQNYTQYCNTLDECEALMDSLSWVDSSGGEMVCPSSLFAQICDPNLAWSVVPSEPASFSSDYLGHVARTPKSRAAA